MEIESQFLASSYIEEDICDYMIRYFDSWSHVAEPGVVWDGYNGGSDGDLNIAAKNSLDLIIGDPDLQDKYFYSLETNLLKDYKKEYSYSNSNSSWKAIQPPQIQKYPIKDGGFYRWHCERTSGINQPIASRHLVYMTYLNDINDGGETEFLYQNIKIKPRKGLTLVWPADWTFTHRGNFAPFEEKYIVTGWFNYTQ